MSVKKEAIKKIATNEKDTGSIEVQCSILTARIEAITEHLKSHKKDFASRRGLLILVGRRRRMLDFLKKESEKRYQDLLSKLELRK